MTAPAETARCVCPHAAALRQVADDLRIVWLAAALRASGLGTYVEVPRRDADVQLMLIAEPAAEVPTRG